ncbi:MAG: bifunctional adenosylcobinamide kinase/adenosylcobinamide-phosphate guanylyltransferase [Acidimicrobiales bacterium]
MITLVLGGARSGKSAYAERLMAHRPLPITYVATMELGDDPDLALRVARHRQGRPGHWRTLEAGLDLAMVLRETTGSVLVESLGPWVARHGEGVAVDGAELCRALAERAGDTVVVSEEVGLGVHPSSALGRWFRDALGALNQEVAWAADRVLLVVAGRALSLDQGP